MIKTIVKVAKVIQLDFVFFFSLDDVVPEEAMHFLSGIVSFDICALFDVDEYCTTEYNNKTFKLEKWTTNCWNQWNPVKNKQSFDWNGGK